MLELLSWLILLAPIWILVLMDATRRSETLKIWSWLVGISYTILGITLMKNLPIEFGYWVGSLVATGGLYYRELILSQASKEGRLTRNRDYPALSERFQTELLIRFIQVSPTIVWIYVITSKSPILVWIIGALMLIVCAIYLAIHEHKCLWKDAPSPTS